MTAAYNAAVETNILCRDQMAIINSVIKYFCTKFGISFTSNHNQVHFNYLGRNFPFSGHS